VLLAPKCANKLATPLGNEDLAILTDLSNSNDMSQCELDKGNIIDFTDEELSPEDRQAREDFMKQRAERDRQEVEKLMKQKAEEDRLHYLSHFKKTREGKVKKIKDITFDTPPPKVPPHVSTSSSPSSFVTVNDLTTVMDSFRLSMIENMQDMVHKSLGKRVEGDDNVASSSKIVAPQTSSINSSAAQTINPQYRMSLNYFAGQTPPPLFGQNRLVRPMGPTGQTSAGTMVPFPSSLEPIVAIAPVQAASGRSGGNISVSQGVPIMVPFETGVGYGYAPNPQVNSRLQHHTSGSYTQPNMMQSNASITPMPTTIQEVIDRFNANLATQMKDDYGIEVKNKNLSYRKSYPSSFDSVPYPIG
jgi:hypothetical protein